MANPMFGLETEYAVTGISDGEIVDRKKLVERLLKVARIGYAHLADSRSNGIFLSNGSRMYIDHGWHPEISTPECTNPWDAVRYIKAGERILGDISGRLASEIGAGTEISFFLCNVDYLRQATWGCHESFLYSCSPYLLPAHIIPHLVTRTIYTGAGGFDPFSEGIRFSLSPRSAHIDQVVSSVSTTQRPIFHTKDEALGARGYHRLHIICGESLCSEWAAWLKTGTTALILAMAEARRHPGRGVGLRSPIAALRTVAADTGCRAMLKLSDGSSSSALKIQRHYLAQAELCLGETFMPVWAEQVCRRWRQILDLLEEGDASVQTRLDWPMKHALFTRHIRSRGSDWASLSCWNHVVDKLQAALKRTSRRGPMHPDFILGFNSPVLEEVARLTPYLRSNGLKWDEWEAFLRLRRELFEIDMRFGQLGSRGVYRSLEEAGLPEHMDGVDNIEHAVFNPPSSGRARIRGECVARFAGAGDRYWCDWSGILDAVEKRFLDLSDPFATEEQWKSISAPLTEQGSAEGLFAAAHRSRIRDFLRL